MFVPETDPQLFDTPPRVLAAQSEKLLLPPRAVFLRAFLGLARKLLEAFGAARPITRQPQVTGRRADGELAAEFAKIDFRLRGQKDELETLLMRGCFPGHPTTNPEEKSPAASSYHRHPSLRGFFPPWARSLFPNAQNLTHPQRLNRSQNLFHRSSPTASFAHEV
jgi:hypothetical protein